MALTTQSDMPYVKIDAQVKRDREELKVAAN